MKVNDAVKQLRRKFPKRQKGTGLLYRGTLPHGSKKFPAITVHVILVNNEGLTSVRQYYFAKKLKTRGEWKGWLDRNFGTILAEGILPALAERHGGFWRLHTMIGWNVHADKRR